MHAKIFLSILAKRQILLNMRLQKHLFTKAENIDKHRNKDAYTRSKTNTRKYGNDPLLMKLEHWHDHFPHLKH